MGKVKGFTLIELIVVIAILSILGLMAMSAYNGGGGRPEAAFVQQIARTDPSYEQGSATIGCSWIQDAIQCSGTARFRDSSGNSYLQQVSGACNEFLECVRY